MPAPPPPQPPDSTPPSPPPISARLTAAITATHARGQPPSSDAAIAEQASAAGDQPVPHNLVTTLRTDTVPDAASIPQLTQLAAAFGLPTDFLTSDDHDYVIDIIAQLELVAATRDAGLTQPPRACRTPPPSTPRARAHHNQALARILREHVE